jgi:8-oxo-dGTP pyrophosphatase MutT (NUDIX family)
MVRRLATASAFADVFVFPGGVVRSDDTAPDPIATDFNPIEALAALTRRGGTPPATADLARGLYRAAIRELFEEAGVLLAGDESNQAIQIPPNDLERWSAYRDALQAGQLTLSELLDRERLTPDYRRLIYFSHWITPESVPRRFDTRFFVAAMPPGQTAVHCRVETTESVWIRPAEALEREAAGSFPLVLPTRIHLRRLAESASLADLLAFSAAKEIRTVLGRLDSRATGGQPVFMHETMPEDW